MGEIAKKRKLMEISQQLIPYLDEKSVDELLLMYYGALEKMIEQKETEE